MLVSFSVTNWRSFRDKATLCMLAGNERRHSDHLARIPKYRMRILPIAVLYGGNASGKSNLLAALAFARDFVVNGTRPGERIPVHPFLLDSDSYHQPIHFSFELLINDTIFEYSFGVTAGEVISEKLVQITSASDRVMFERESGQIEFAPGLKRPQFLRFAFEGTRENELFLTNSVSQNVDRFRPVSDWFRSSLRLGGPATGMFHSLSHDDLLRGRISKLLRQYDTGIEELKSHEIPLESFPLPEEAAGKLFALLKEGHGVPFPGPGGQLFSLERKGGRMRVAKLVAIHRNADRNATPFDIAMESDGSRRLIELLPLLIELSGRGHGTTCVVDELDRSLHHALSRSLVEAFLEGCNEHSRSQLIFTTHDLHLMDQLLFRRDEMWVTERLSSGNTRLYSFSEFKGLRADTDLRRAYINGRLGGVPHFGYPPMANQDELPPVTR